MLGERDLDRIEAQNGTFHQRVRQAYLKLAEAHPKRWVLIDGQRSVDEVAEAVWEIVKQRLGKT